jgi:hypothetical protein
MLPSSPKRTQGGLPHRRPTALQPRNARDEQTLQMNHHSIRCPEHNRADRLRVSNDNRRSRPTHRHNVHRPDWEEAMLLPHCGGNVYNTDSHRASIPPSSQQSQKTVDGTDRVILLIELLCPHFCDISRSKVTWIPPRGRSESSKRTKTIEKTSAPFTT